MCLCWKQRCPLACGLQPLFQQPVLSTRRVSGLLATETQTHFAGKAQLLSTVLMTTSSSTARQFSKLTAISVNDRWSSTEAQEDEVEEVPENHSTHYKSTDKQSRLSWDSADNCRLCFWCKRQHWTVIKCNCWTELLNSDSEQSLPQVPEVPQFLWAFGCNRTICAQSLNSNDVKAPRPNIVIVSRSGMFWAEVTVCFCVTFQSKTKNDHSIITVRIISNKLKNQLNVNALHLISLKFPQCCLKNDSKVGLIYNDPVALFHPLKPTRAYIKYTLWTNPAGQKILKSFNLIIKYWNNLVILNSRDPGFLFLFNSTIERMCLSSVPCGI